MYSQTEVHVLSMDPVRPLTLCAPQFYNQGVGSEVIQKILGHLQYSQLFLKAQLRVKTSAHNRGLDKLGVLEEMESGIGEVQCLISPFP